MHNFKMFHEVRDTMVLVKRTSLFLLDLIPCLGQRVRLNPICSLEHRKPHPHAQADLLLGLELRFHGRVSRL